MYSDHYKHELRLLRELAAEFAEAHPQLAGLLRGPSGDPDVERLLEGTAFLAADIRAKLDDEFPELLHALAAVVCPQQLRPVPAATVVAFSPRAALKQTLTVAAGTHLDSVPVDGVACRFRTCFPVEVAPLALASVSRPDLERRTGRGQIEIRLSLQAKGVALENLKLDRLRFHLGGDFLEACDLYALLTHQLREIQIEAGNRVAMLAPDALRPLGWGRDDALLPRERGVLPAYATLQEYFLFPEKFLFLELDLAGWRERGGERLEITFFCEPGAVAVPKLGPEKFALFATPAVNLFRAEAEPLVLDQRQAELQVRPAADLGQGLWVYSVDRVEGIGRGAAGKREYRPFSAFGAARGPVYHTVYRPAVLGEDAEVHLACALPPEVPLLDREILRVELTCSHGSRPEQLLPGDIRVPTVDTPELVDFTNLTVPSPARRPPLGRDLLWQLIAHLSLNYLSVADGANLQALLRHYAGAGDRARDLANQQRIDAILGLAVSPDQRLYGGAFVRGQQLTLRWRGDRFAGEGDRFLFGTVLDRFFASCAMLNSYTALTAEDASSGARTQWPPRLGTQALL